MTAALVTSSTSSYSPVWTYNYPHLVEQSVDRTFNEWGTKALYQITAGTDRFNSASITVSHREPGDEMIQADHDFLRALAKEMLHAWAIAWMDEYRKTEAYCAAGHDKTRAESLLIAA